MLVAGFKGEKISDIGMYQDVWDNFNSPGKVFVWALLLCFCEQEADTMRDNVSMIGGPYHQEAITALHGRYSSSYYVDKYLAKKARKAQLNIRALTGKTSRPKPRIRVRDIQDGTTVGVVFAVELIGR